MSFSHSCTLQLFLIELQPLQNELGILTLHGNCDSTDCDPNAEVTFLTSPNDCDNVVMPEVVPGTQLQGHVGGLVGPNKIPTACGGYSKDSSTISSKCYQLIGIYVLLYVTDMTKVT